VTLKSVLEVTQGIENGAVRKFWYGFLFPFHSNYGRIFSCLDTIHERDGHHTDATRRHSTALKKLEG